MHAHVQPASLRLPITDPGQRAVGSERPDHCRDGQADLCQRAIRRQCPSHRGRTLVPNRITLQPKVPQRAIGHERIRQHRRTCRANPIVIEIELLAKTRGAGAHPEREMSTMGVRATWDAPMQAPDAAHRHLSPCG